MRVLVAGSVVAALCVVAALVVFAIARAVNRKVTASAIKNAKWEIYSSPTGRNAVAVGVRRMGRKWGKPFEIAREETAQVNVRDNLESSIDLQVARTEASNRAINYNAMDVS